MTQPSFERLFCLPAFEGLRALRIQIGRTPDEEIERQCEIVRNTDANAPTFDLEAATFLHQIVPDGAPLSSVLFYRFCLAAVLKKELPSWAKLMTLGRGRFIKRLKAPEYRDIRSLFRQASLLNDPASPDDIEWWDSIQAHVRQQKDAEKMKQAREAELLSLEHERMLLAQQGISEPPKWMAIEDNTVGYDVLSYEVGEHGLINKLIEVKSTIASPLRFFLTRNEWNEAKKYGAAYVFHVWDMSKSPPMLHERNVAQIEPHVPHDNHKGEWKTAFIPVGI